MEKYNGSLIRQFDSESTGNAGASVSVTVRTLPSLGLATIYSVNDTSSNPLSNPLQTDSRGRYSFYAVNGRYQLDFGTGEDSIEILLQDGIDEQAVQDIIDQLETEALSRSKVSSPVTLTSGQTLVSFEGFNASLSSYYISSVGGDVPSYRLFEGQHYTIEDEVTEEITLLETYPAGTNLYAASLDPTGTGVVATPSQFETVAEMQAATSIPVGSVVEVVENGSARYKISASGTTVNIGDKTLNNGQVAVLQPLPNGDWDATHFGVVDDPSNTAGSQIELLRNAAKRAAIKLGTVSIPNIKINVAGSPINEQVFWRLAPKTEFNGLPGVSPSFVYDMTQLGGKLIAYRDAATTRGGMLYLGDPTYAVQKETTRSQTSSVIVGASQNAGGGVGGYTNSKPATNSDQGTIALKGVALNDNLTLPRTVWAGYLESVNLAGTTGITQTLELAMVNKGVVADFTPASAVNDNRVGLTMNLWVGTGIGEASDTDSTMAIGIVGGVPASTAKFLRGIVFKEGCTRTGEVIAASANDQIAWYDTRAVGNGKLSYISGANTSSNRGRVAIGTRNLAAQTFNEYTFDRVSFSYSVNNSVDLGGSSNRFKSLYLQNSPDVVSDADKKTSKRDMSDKELSAGLELARNVQMFKWISEVAEKGESNAYYHTSVMAQEAWQILTDNELDPTDYGFISNQEGNWSVMPTELSMLMCAALVKNQDLLEQRIAALENV